VIHGGMPYDLIHENSKVKVTEV